MAHTIVIFGASGDLTSRKLIPALYELHRKKRLPEETRVVGFSRTPVHARRLARRSWPSRPPSSSASKFDAALVAASSPRRSSTTPATSATPTISRRLREFLAKLEGEAGGHARLLPFHGAAVLRAGRRPARRGRPGRTRTAAAPRRDRKALRHRPGHRPRAQRAAPRGLRRAAGLPHRPLPGQGDGAEHPGAAVRQRDLRADLEPQLHRPRADHGGRGTDRRPPRGLLRFGRHPARHVPEPPAATDDVHGDGGPVAIRGRRRARREGEGAAVDPPHEARGGGHRHDPRPVSQVSRRAGRSARQRNGHVRRRSSCTSTTGGGRACRSICAAARRCRAAPRRS